MSSPTEELIAAWRTLQTSSPPFILDEDKQVLDSWNDRQTRKGMQPIYYPAQNWSDYLKSIDFGAPGDSRLHTSLLPMPFVGDLSRATIFILMLNPGFGPLDYFGESNVPEYRDALVANLRQEAQPEGFLFLDPRFSWHGGYRYWHKKLTRLIAEIASRRKVSYDAARRTLQQAVAAVELVPYHSATFDVPGTVRKKLNSAGLARAFATELARRSDCLVIVTRNSRDWNLRGVNSAGNVVEYSVGAARAAHLTPNSPGGGAILQFLSRL